MKEYQYYIVKSHRIEITFYIFVKCQCLSNRRPRIRHPGTTRVPLATPHSRLAPRPTRASRHAPPLILRGRRQPRDVADEFERVAPLDDCEPPADSLFAGTHQRRRVSGVRDNVTAVPPSGVLADAVDEQGTSLAAQGRPYAPLLWESVLQVCRVSLARGGSVPLARDRIDRTRSGVRLFWYRFIHLVVGNLSIF